MARGEPKIFVTVQTNRKKRTYTGEYVYLSVLSEDNVGNRWEQEPVGWKDGLGLFFSGMAALRAVAEQEGDERFKVAARAALDAMASFDPDRALPEKCAKKKRAVRKTKSTD